MRVYTKSGSCYEFVVRDGAFWTVFEGRDIQVTDFENLEVGKRLTVWGYKLDIYGKPQHTKSFFKTSEILKIVD